MILNVGDKVVYPCQGPCLIDTVVVRTAVDKPKSFYHLIVLDGNGGELYVPLEKAQAVGIRQMLNRTEIPMLLDHMKKPSKIAKDWRQRANDILKLFMSGSAFDLAEIIQSLSELREKKELSLREDWTLRKARTLLICEISEVLGETRIAAEERIDLALKERNGTELSEAPQFVELRKASY